MKTTLTSTLSLWNSPRTALARMQTDFAKANKEIATGRHADVGLELGQRTGHGINLRQDRAELDAFVEANGLAGLRLSVTRNALDQVRTSAQSLLEMLVAGSSTRDHADLLTKAAATSLNTLATELNGTAGGQYIFAGINTSEKPVEDYASGPKLAVDAAFMTAFGITQTDPAVGAITAAQMDSFLDGPFAALFDDPGWSTWSSAASQNLDSRISTTEQVETSTNANEPAMRKLAMTYTMVAHLGFSGLHADVQDVVVNKAASILGVAAKEVTAIQAHLGTAEKKVSDANIRIGIQKNILDLEIGRLENTDPLEAKSRLDAIMTQMQMSYSLTSQIRQLGLINYL